MQRHINNIHNETQRLVKGVMPTSSYIANQQMDEFENNQLGVSWNDNKLTESNYVPIKLEETQDVVAFIKDDLDFVPAPGEGDARDPNGQFEPVLVQILFCFCCRAPKS